MLNTAWAKKTYTRLRFYETTTAQCLPVNHSPLFTGIRIRVDPYKKVKTLSGIIVDSPYVLAVGTQIKNRPDGIVLDLSAPLFTSKIAKNCTFGYGEDTCINTANIHEFGHVIGISHEQNRSDAVVAGSRCKNNDILTGFKDSRVGTLPTDLLIGNIRIGDYDLNSIMNYCNPKTPPAWTLSPTDITRRANLLRQHAYRIYAPQPYRSRRWRTQDVCVAHSL